MNDKLPKLTVADRKRFGGQKYSLTDVPYLPEYDALILIDDKNRVAAEEDIMLIYGLLSTARQIDDRVPVLHIYSDDIRFEGSCAIEPSLFTYLQPFEARGESGQELLLHYYVTPDERDSLYGDIYYGADGNIIRYTVCFERERETFFIDAEGGSDGILTVKNVVLSRKKRRRRFYPLIKINRHAGYIISGTIIIVAALSTLGLIMTGGEREYNRDVVIALPPAVTEQNADTTGYADALPSTELSNAVMPSAEASVTAKAEMDKDETQADEVEIDKDETQTDQAEVIAPPSDKSADGNILVKAETAEAGLSISSLTTPIKRGSTATLKARGRAGAFYSITVMYSSGKSKADGLEKKVCDDGGAVEWSWKIGSRTKAGKYVVTVEGGGETAEAEIEITE